MFLGRLSIDESAHLMERLVRYIMIKAVFLSAVVATPDPAELAMWLAWCAQICSTTSSCGSSSLCHRGPAHHDQGCLPV